jgi:hypothetical protein
MDEIKEEPHNQKRNLKRYLSALCVGLVVFIIAEGLLFVKEQASHKIYELCLLLFVVLSLVIFFAASRHKKSIKNKK